MTRRAPVIKAVVRGVDGYFVFSTGSTRPSAGKQVVR